MALTCKAFGGFEMGGPDEAHSKLGLAQADFSTSYTPAHGTERWVLVLPEANPTKKFRTDYCTPVDFLIFGGVFQFSSVGPNPPVDFMCGITSGPDYDIRARLNTNGTLGIINANGNQLDSGGSPSINTWHRIELYWQRVGSSGVAELYLDGTKVADTGSGDFINDAGDTDVALELAGQLGVATVSCRTLVNSFYYLSGATSPSQRLGDYEVLGPYQTYHNVVEADAKVGGGAPDDLDLGSWLGMSDIPTLDMPYAKYNQNHQGCKRTMGTQRAGPGGDGRVVNANIVAASWVYAAYQASAVAQYGRYDNSASTYYLAEGSAIPDSGNLSIVVDAGSTYVPDADDYFCLGFRSNSVKGSIIKDASAYLLQTITAGERTRLHLKGGHLKGSRLIP